MKELPSNVYGVILAGGSGTRFWPKSRTDTPKQLCKISDPDLTMLELTLARLDGLIPPERRIIVTHERQVAKTKQVAGPRCQHYLAEPQAKNTANALALAALEIQAISDNPEPVMISLHADHVIKHVEQFQTTLHAAVSVAQHDQLVLLGLKPEYPETGYGYIEQGKPLDSTSNGFRVASFREKPDQEIAEQYVAQGNFFWNSGLFVWKTKVLLQELRQYLPHTISTLTDVLNGCQSFSQVPQEALTTAYGNLQSIAIDHAVLEVSKHVAMIPADIGWKDVGSWDALADCRKADAQGNIVPRDSILIDCENSVIDSDGQLVAAIGLRDMVVAVANGAVLVCPKSRAQEVKQVVERLKEQQRLDLI